MSTDTAVRKAITVAVPQEKAFSAFTAGINRWWPRDHHIGQAELDEAIIEGREGGRWYELRWLRRSVPDRRWRLRGVRPADRCAGLPEQRPGCVVGPHERLEIQVSGVADELLSAIEVAGLERDHAREQ